MLAARRCRFRLARVVPLLLPLEFVWTAGSVLANVVHKVARIAVAGGKYGMLSWGGMLPDPLADLDLRERGGGTQEHCLQNVRHGGIAPTCGMGESPLALPICPTLLALIGLVVWEGWKLSFAFWGER